MFTLSSLSGPISVMMLVMMFLLFTTIPFSIATVSELPFLDLGDETRVSGEGKFFGILDFALMLNDTELPIPFPFDNGTETKIYISTHGLISFGGPFTNYTPSQFPISVKVVTPYWDDIDLRQKGLFLYAALIQGKNSHLSNSLAIFDTVNGYITDTVLKGASVFQASWILAVRWIDTCPIIYPRCISTNTFQAVLATDGVRSYAIYTYECGKLNWRLYNAGIGFSASPSFYAEHPLSRNSSVNEIACINKNSTPSSNWSNVVYQINSNVPAGALCQVKSIAENSTSITVSWSAPAGVIIEYQLQCYGGNQIFNWTVMGSQVTTTLSGLQPYTNYSCNITAHNSFGGGPAAATSVTTKESIPAGPPRQVMSIAENSTSIIINWSAPATPNGVIAEYQLQCSGRGHAFSHTVIGTQMTTTLSGLLPYTNYSCSITAHSSVGGGPAATTSVTTKESIPGKIEEITVLNPANQHTVMIVKWDPPTVPNGVITGYLLNVSTISSTVYFIPNIKNNTITLTNLSHFVPYYVSVAALTSKGNGEFLTKIAFTLQGIPVNGPRNVLITRQISTQLEVKWEPLSLEEARGFITHYTVTAEPASSQKRRQAEGTLSVTVGANSTSAVLDGLSSVLTYWITVSASTVVGSSTSNNRCLAKLSASSLPIICSSSIQDTTSISSFTQLIVSAVVTFLLTCICTFVISSLLCFLVMKRLLKAKAQRNQLSAPHGIDPTERMYEMVNTEKAAEAVYDFIDHDKKEMAYKENPAYAVHTYHH